MEVKREIDDGLIGEGGLEDLQLARDNWKGEREEERCGIVFIKNKGKSKWGCEEKKLLT